MGGRHIPGQPDQRACPEAATGAGHHHPCPRATVLGSTGRLQQRIHDDLAESRSSDHVVQQSVLQQPRVRRAANVKISKYNNIADVTGARQQLLGAPVTAAGASDNGEGYLPVGQLINDVIAPLQTAWGKAFGGVMGFEFALDEDGAWARQIGQALGRPPRAARGVPHRRGEDTLAVIAQRYLGSSDRWVDLRKPDGTPFTPEEAQDLQVGQLVCIPGEIYAVVAGDTLAGIAQRFLGNGDLWVDLMKPDGTPFTPKRRRTCRSASSSTFPVSPTPSWRVTPSPSSPSDTSATATSGSTSENQMAHHSRRKKRKTSRSASSFTFPRRPQGAALWRYWKRYPVPGPWPGSTTRNRTAARPNGPTRSTTRRADSRDSGAATSSTNKTTSTTAPR